MNGNISIDLDGNHFLTLDEKKYKVSGTCSNGRYETVWFLYKNGRHYKTTETLCVDGNTRFDKLVSTY